LSDSAASGSTTSGTFTPLRFEIGPPAITVQFGEIGAAGLDLQAILPSLTSSRAPGSSAAKISGGAVARACIARRRVEVEAEGAPVLEVVALAIGEDAAAQLRPLQVGKDRDGAARILLDLRMAAWRARISSWPAMAHVEAEDVRPGLVEARIMS
jgi:hypothetical protein